MLFRLFVAKSTACKSNVAFASSASTAKNFALFLLFQNGVAFCCKKEYNTTYFVWYNAEVCEKKEQFVNKIGVITDIHGNLPALVAVLQLLDEQGCNEIIFCGDVVDMGPHGTACFELLCSRKDVTMIVGNHDRDFALDNYYVHPCSHVPKAHKEYVFANTDARFKQKVLQMPLFVTRQCGGQTLRFCHYAMVDGVTDISSYPFLSLENFPTREIFDRQYKNVQCDAVFFGHKHEPCDIVGDKIYCCVGSVACHREQLAKAVVIEYDEHSWRYKRVSAPYDATEFTKQLLAMPCAGIL